MLTAVLESMAVGLIVIGVVVCATFAISAGWYCEECGTINEARDLDCCGCGRRCDYPNEPGLFDNH